MSISFLSADRTIPLKSRRKVKMHLNLLFQREKQNLQKLSYVFCSDEFLLDINQQFLKHNFYTDIITFDLADNATAVNGEVYISVDRVKDNAIQLKESFEREMLRVVFHGALHLCGYKDKTQAQKLKMRQKEDYYLSVYKL